MPRVTLNDVSARAGVSRSTASLVLRGSSKISAATQERVRAAIEELGYIYDRTAANLRQSRTMTVGLVMTDLRNPFFAELTMAAEHELHEAGYTLFIGYSRDDAARQEEIVSAMVERRVDGLTYLPAVGTDRTLVDRLARQHVPAVPFARHLDGGVGGYVGPDNVTAGRLLGAHLQTIGIRDAVFLGGAPHSSAYAERLSGLRDGAGPEVSVEAHTSTLSEPTSAAGVALVSDLLDSGLLPECIVAYNDIMAIGVSAGLRARGFEPGKDIAVAGFDDIEAAAQQVPALTSVATHAEEVGAACARALLGLIDETPDGHASPVLITPHLRVRASTGSWRPRRENR